MNFSTRSRLAGLAMLLAGGLVVAGCGGGGGSMPAGPPPSPLQGSISGTVVKGPVGGGTVTAYAVVNGMAGAALGSATTDAAGNFTIALGSHGGTLMLQLTGGSYVDEASGATVTLRAGEVMTAVVPTLTAGAATTGIQLTPLTSMAQAMAAHRSGGLVDANVASANAAVGAHFMVSDILHVAPMNPLVSGAGSGSQDAINYGMTLAAMSKFAQTVGMTSSAAMVTAMMNDAADGTLDGQVFGGAVMMGGMGTAAPLPATAGTAGLASAMLAFLGSTANHSGVTPAMMSGLLNSLNGSNGSMMGAGSPAAVNTSVSGTAFFGTMHQGMVTAFAVVNGARGAQLASAPMTAQGGYSLALGGYSGAVMLQVRDGSYLDEATATTMIMDPSDVMTAVLPTMAVGTASTGIWVTPLSAMAQRFAAGMAGGMTDGNIGTANSGVGNYFNIMDLLHVAPMDPFVSGAATGATSDQRNCGVAIAAMSELAKSLGLTTSTTIVTAMMDDASDGMMDGRSSGVAITMTGMMGGSGMMSPSAGRADLAAAMTTFLAAPVNVSGLDATMMNALIQRLAASSGAL